ncbi:MAG: hypothetical protein NUV81_00455, partial [bacterium]|nr:hypothetical protein [bacterium]
MSQWTLTHEQSETDEERQQKQDSFLAEHPLHRLVSALISQIRGIEPDWWPATGLRQDVPVFERMSALRDRPDRREFYVHGNTNLPRLAARAMEIPLQTDMIDLCIDVKAITVTTFEGAFLPDDYVCYMDPRRFWHMFMERYPWDADEQTTEEIQLITWLIDELLSAHRQNNGVQFMSHLEVLSIIPSIVWQKYIQTDLHCLVRDERYLAERSSRAFGPIDEIELVSTETIATCIPHSVIFEIMNSFEKKSGLHVPEPEVEQETAPDSEPPEDPTMETLPSPQDGDSFEGDDDQKPPPVGRLNTPAPHGSVEDVAPLMQECQPPDSGVNPPIEEERSSQGGTLTPPAQIASTEEDHPDTDPPPSEDDEPNEAVEITYNLTEAGFHFSGLGNIDLRVLISLREILLDDKKPRMGTKHILAMALMLKGQG